MSHADPFPSAESFRYPPEAASTPAPKVSRYTVDISGASCTTPNMTAPSARSPPAPSHTAAGTASRPRGRHQRTIARASATETTNVHAPRRKKFSTMKTSPVPGRRIRASKYVRAESNTPLRIAAAYTRRIQNSRTVAARAPGMRSASGPPRTGPGSGREGKSNRRMSATFSVSATDVIVSSPMDFAMPNPNLEAKSPGSNAPPERNPEGTSSQSSA